MKTAQDYVWEIGDILTEMDCPKCDGNGCKKCGNSGTHPQASKALVRLHKLWDVLIKDKDKVWRIK